jgi:ribulose bisphosphate carboxylase small subunit
MYYGGDFFMIGDKYQNYSGTLKEIKKYLKDYVNKYVRIENN